MRLGLLTAESMWHQKVFTDQDTWPASVGVKSLDDGAPAAGQHPAANPTELRRARQHPTPPCECTRRLWCKRCGHANDRLC